MDPVTFLGVALLVVGIVGLYVTVPRAQKANMAAPLVVWMYFIYVVWFLVGIALLFVPDVQVFVREVFNW